MYIYSNIYIYIYVCIVGPPSDVCWFISPSNYIYKYHKQ